MIGLWFPGSRAAKVFRRIGLVVAGLAPAGALAQAPAWAAATVAAAAAGGIPQVGSTSSIVATATDASGNVFVTGSFYGTVAFGSTVLTGANTVDLFVAKYVPATGTWAWAQSGGGTGLDQGHGIAVSGNSVYVTGNIENTNTDARSVRFGGTGTIPGTVPQYGASNYIGNDLVLAKYTDHGSSVTLGWTQVAGGNNDDEGTSVAVRGTSVYVTGHITNDVADRNLVRFGGTGRTSGTVPQYGVSGTSSQDVLLAKYTDNGPTATLNWTQAGGGNDTDGGSSVAVSGSNVYVTGAVLNDLRNSRGVVFGGGGTTAGTVQVNGASNTNAHDVVLAKYTDNGPTATLDWVQVGGGTGSDAGAAVAVSGTSVYVTGYIANNQADGNGVRFGGGGTTPGIVPVPGASPANSADVVVAKYLDNGPTATLAWAQVGGGTGRDEGHSVALDQGTVVVAGSVEPSASFGPFVVGPVAGRFVGFVALLRDPMLTTASGRGAAHLTLYPNPAYGTAALSGLPTGAAVQVLDARGRPVARATADAAGTAQLALPAGLAPGVYIVRSGAAALRLTVE